MNAITRCGAFVAALLVSLAACGGESDDDGFQAPGDVSDTADVTEDAGDVTPDPDTATDADAAEDIASDVDVSSDADAAEVSAVCGDGVVNADEACDGADLGAQSCEGLGYAGGTLACSDDCTFDESACETAGNPVCGNGEVEGAEACDDGNRTDEDGCAADCISEFCGDGIVQPGLDEECDAGAAFASCEDDVGVGLRYCSDTCALETLLCPDPAACGNGTRDLGESCDDGNVDDGDGCSSTCASETCGDDVLDELEACDGDALRDWTCGDFGFNAGDVSCSETCSVVYEGCFNTACGDGRMSGAEACDDGNTDDGDGCDRRCRLESCDGGEDPVPWWPDVDEDTYGDDSAVPMWSCGEVVGSVTRAGDCVDSDDAVSPDGVEACDSEDTNCDGIPDPADCAEPSPAFGVGLAGELAYQVIDADRSSDEIGREVLVAQLDDSDANDVLILAEEFTADGGGWVYGFLNVGADITGADAADFVIEGVESLKHVVTGDLDGDGDTELVISDPADNRVHIWLGRADWTSEPPTIANADIVLSRSTVFDSAGSSLAVGDLDGDGDDELVVGIEGYQSARGALAIHGLDGASIETGDAYTTGTAYFGGETDSVVGANLLVDDFDGDGTPDIAVYTAYEDANPLRGLVGDVRLLSGPFAASATPTVLDDRVTQRITGVTALGRMCRHMAAVPSMNGNASAELICESRDLSLVFDFADLEAIATESDALLSVEAAAGSYGVAVSGGDVDGDGIGDIVIGVAARLSGTGLMGVFPGADMPRGELAITDATGQISGDDRDELFGNTIHVLDLDGDGFDEVITTAPSNSAFGSLYFFRGGPLP